MACVSAEDLNESNLNQGNPHDLETSEEPSNSTPAASGAPETNEINSDSQPKSYLILDNDADIENIYIGDYVTWIVSVINNGPDTAKNVKVYDQLPDGLKYIKHTTTKGIFNPETGIWSIGDLSIIDGEVFLNITTKALSVGEKINKAKVTSDTYNLNENESYEEEEIDVFEHEVKAYTEKSILSTYATGSPIALIVLSIFTILITSTKSK